MANNFTEYKTTLKGEKWQACTIRDHVGVRGHRNLNFTEWSVISRYQNFNAPKICKITVYFVGILPFTNLRSMYLWPKVSLFFCSLAICLAHAEVSRTCLIRLPTLPIPSNLFLSSHPHPSSSFFSVSLYPHRKSRSLYKFFLAPGQTCMTRGLANFLWWHVHALAWPSSQPATWPLTQQPGPAHLAMRVVSPLFAAHAGPYLHWVLRAGGCCFSPIFLLLLLRLLLPLACPSCVKALHRGSPAA